MIKKRGQVIITIITASLIIAVYAVIFSYSAMPQAESAVQSMTVTEQIVATIEKLFRVDLPFNNSPESIDRLDGVVRKAAHFSEYALLGLLTFVIPLCWHFKRQSGVVGSFLFVALLAAADEFHQTFVPGRAGRIADVVLDCCGCLAGIGVMWVVSNGYERLRRKRHNL
ncbi:MAG: VanZ family protein [Lachnospiraceae bacterium]|jgi:VanZ family protein|nr:VanZ family protein [Lachnospiraceae bacterium]